MITSYFQDQVPRSSARERLGSEGLEHQADPSHRGRVPGGLAHEGTTRERRAWNADPELIRRLDVGQACYIHRGAATFAQVARPRPSPPSLLHPARPGAGDVPRDSDAAAAYAILRTPWGRSEAFADLAAAVYDTSPLPVIP